MTENKDENSSVNGSPPDGVTDEQTAVSPDDPGVTPLGGNTGVHIHTDDDSEDPPDEPDPSEGAIDFGGFVVSLGTSCMISLGKHPNPETGRTITDLPAATEVIEILEMLERKTRGNLDHKERQLLETLLRDLRRAYDESAT